MHLNVVAHGQATLVGRAVCIVSCFLKLFPEGRGGAMRYRTVKHEASVFVTQFSLIPLKPPDSSQFSSLT